MNDPLNPTQTEQQDMVELRAKAHEWIDGLLIAGVAENATVQALMVALIDRGLARRGLAETAAWLRRMASFVERAGPVQIEVLRSEGRIA